MRTSHVATTLIAVTAGLTAVTALHRRSGRRLPAPAPAAVDAAAREGVVLPFARPVPGPVVASAPAAPERSAAPARCGDSGGRTKAGTPCGGRATAAGRCHHHRQAA
jgi:hypothetical protein